MTFLHKGTNLIRIRNQSRILLFKIVETPGFADPSSSDNRLIQDMVQVLHDDLVYTNVVLLLGKSSVKY